jgi:hypothetical protein
MATIETNAKTIFNVLILVEFMMPISRTTEFGQSLLSVIPSGNVTLHPVNSGEAAIMKACPERAERVEWEESLTINQHTMRDVSTPLDMTKTAE